MSTLELLSLILSVVSIVLSLVAMKLASRAESEVRANFERTKDVLADIRTESASMKATVENSHVKLIDSVTHLLTSRFDPPRRATVEDRARTKLLDVMIRTAEKDPAAMRALLRLTAADGSGEEDARLVKPARLNKPNNTPEPIVAKRAEGSA